MRKKVMRIPKRVTLLCPLCNEKSRVEIAYEASLPFFNCPKCEQRIVTPLAQCCAICAFSKTKCPASLVMEAKIKRLEIRY